MTQNTLITYAFNNYCKFISTDYDELLKGIKKIKKMTVFQLQPVEIECKKNITSIIENKRKKLYNTENIDDNSHAKHNLNGELDNEECNYKIYSHQMINIEKIKRSVISDNLYLIRSGEIKTAIISNSKKLLNALDNTIIPLLGGAKISKIPIDKKRIPPQILYKQKDTAIIFTGNTILRDENTFTYAVSMGLSIAKNIIIIISGIRNGKAILCDNKIYEYVSEKIIPKYHINDFSIITCYDILTTKQIKIFQDILLNPIFHYLDHESLEKYAAKV